MVFQPQNDPASSVSLPTELFVGRHRELADLKVVLEDAVSGHGRLVMLVGEPGIGKTRTAKELASHSQGRGAQVLWGWCYQVAALTPTST